MQASAPAHLLRALLVLLLILALPAPLAAEDEAAVPSPSEPLSLETVGRSLDAERPDLDRLGRLKARGILEMSSPNPRFGGLSGLLVDPDGGRLQMISDDGAWLSVRPLLDEAGNLSGLGDARISFLANPSAWKTKFKTWRDAESLAWAERGIYVSFEHAHRIWRYDLEGAGASGGLANRPRPLAIPEEIEALPKNEGIEALETLADGSLLAIASKTAEEGLYPAFLRREGGWERLLYRRTPPFEPTGAALLPNGDLMVLERRFSLLGGLGVRLVQVPGDSIRPGAVLEGAEVARFKPPLLLDNFEGIAAYRGQDGETLIYIVSDDNFNPLQRNYLLLFELLDEAVPE